MQYQPHPSMPGAFRPAESLRALAYRKADDRLPSRGPFTARPSCIQNAKSRSRDIAFNQSQEEFCAGRRMLGRVAWSVSLPSCDCDDALSGLDVLMEDICRHRK